MQDIMALYKNPNAIIPGTHIYRHILYLMINNVLKNSNCFTIDLVKEHYLDDAYRKNFDNSVIFCKVIAVDRDIRSVRDFIDFTLSKGVMVPVFNFIQIEKWRRGIVATEEVYKIMLKNLIDITIEAGYHPFNKDGLFLFGKI